jgi:hypothetical protein
MVRLKKVDVLSCAKMSAVSGGVIGLVLGVLYSFGGAVYELFTDSLNLGTALAFGALVGMPAILAALGFLKGALLAALYNYTTKWVDGLALDLEEIDAVHVELG